jgi:hypothetical protein
MKGIPAQTTGGASISQHSRASPTAQRATRPSRICCSVFTPPVERARLQTIGTASCSAALQPRVSPDVRAISFAACRVPTGSFIICAASG